MKTNEMNKRKRMMKTMKIREEDKDEDNEEVKRIGEDNKQSLDASSNETLPSFCACSLQ